MAEQSSRSQKSRRSRKKARSKQAIASPATNGQTTDHHEEAGIVCIVDVEKFSTIKTLKQQISLVRNLWQASQKTELIREAGPNAHINGTGDGLLIAVPFTPSRMKQALRWATDLITDKQVTQFNKKLRFGIHCGPYTILGGDPGKMAVGIALNECARVAGIGDGGHVIVSEAFVRRYADHEDWPAIMGVFEPGEEDQHYTVLTKHGAKVNFRIYRTTDDSPPIPRRLKIMQVARQNIQHALPRIAESFVAALREHITFPSELRASAHPLDVRVCVFEPASDSEILVSDEFRYHRENQHVRPSEAEYSLRGEGTGVCGRAFCSKSPVVMHNLRIRKEDKIAYDDAHVALGVSQPTIDRWQRHARSFVAFPFSVVELEEKSTPLGVVCIDVMEPLSWMAQEELKGVGSDLMKQYGVLLGALFSLRF